MDNKKRKETSTAPPSSTASSNSSKKSKTSSTPAPSSSTSKSAPTLVKAPSVSAKTTKSSNNNSASNGKPSTTKEVSVTFTNNAQCNPLLGEFRGGAPPVSALQGSEDTLIVDLYQQNSQDHISHTSTQQQQQQKRKITQQLLLLAQTKKMEYKGTCSSSFITSSSSSAKVSSINTNTVSSGSGNAGGNSSKYLVGVYDKNKKSLTLLPTPGLFTMQQKVKEPVLQPLEHDLYFGKHKLNQVNGSLVTSGLDFNEKRLFLFEAFSARRSIQMLKSGSERSLANTLMDEKAANADDNNNNNNEDENDNESSNSNTNLFDAELGKFLDNSDKKYSVLNKDNNIATPLLADLPGPNFETTNVTEAYDISLIVSDSDRAALAPLTTKVLKIIKPAFKRTHSWRTYNAINKFIKAQKLPEIFHEWLVDAGLVNYEHTYAGNDEDADESSDAEEENAPKPNNNGEEKGEGEEKEEAQEEEENQEEEEQEEAEKQAGGDESAEVEAGYKIANLIYLCYMLKFFRAFKVRSDQGHRKSGKIRNTSFEEFAAEQNMVPESPQLVHAMFRRYATSQRTRVTAKMASTKSFTKDNMLVNHDILHEQLQRFFNYAMVLLCVTCNGEFRVKPVQTAFKIDVVTLHLHFQKLGLRAKPVTVTQCYKPNTRKNKKKKNKNSSSSSSSSTAPTADVDMARLALPLKLTAQKRIKSETWVPTGFSL